MKRLFINTLILTISISCFGMTPDRNNDKTVKRTVVTTKTTTSKNTHFGRKPTNDGDKNRCHTSRQHSRMRDMLQEQQEVMH